jgi:Domain of unknown function (DUF4332)/Zinc dependent phospholipase C
MTLALSVIRAAHAHGTHHQLALDALSEMTGPSARAWERLFYKYITEYVTGAKAPDVAFKDFKNHVLHPRDGYWGGAATQAATWYEELVKALKRQDWPAVAYSAGVLSHYCTDPMEPLHTHQTAAENNIHRALEWSVSKSYADLRKLGLKEYGHIKIVAVAGEPWLTRLIREGAAKANTRYETLLAHYDIKRGVVSPPDGLDIVGQRVIAEMLVYASRLFSVVLERALVDAAIAPPEVSLARDALTAFVSMPKAWWLKRGLDASDRAVVEAMYDELMATGAVRDTLPEDERQIVDLYAREVLAKKASASPDTGSSVIADRGKPGKRTVTETKLNTDDASRDDASRDDDPRLDPPDAGDVVVPMRRPLAVEKPRPAPKRRDAPIARLRAAAAKRGTPEPSGETTPDPAESPQEPAAVQVAVAEPMPAEANAAAATLTALTPVHVPVPEIAVPQAALSTWRPAGRTGMKLHLTLESNIVDAPSIGPKTAQKFNAVGIDTVGDFLKAHPIALASRLESLHTPPDVLAAWQDQARLVCEIAELRGNHARLLVGAGYRTAAAIADADVGKMCSDILAYAVTADGQRILRDGHPPDIEQVKSWAENAQASRAA